MPIEIFLLPVFLNDLGFLGVDVNRVMHLIVFSLDVINHVDQSFLTWQSLLIAPVSAEGRQINLFNSYFCTIVSVSDFSAAIEIVL